jgi:hypothetical protein
MKHIYRFRDKGYVHMDSYPENHETHFDLFQNILVGTIVVVISAITGAALVGVDITNPQLWNNGNAHSTGR